jgi:hypothetical protein
MPFQLPILSLLIKQLLVITYHHKSTSVNYRKQYEYKSDSVEKRECIDST